MQFIVQFTICFHCATSILWDIILSNKSAIYCRTLLRKPHYGISACSSVVFPRMLCVSQQPTSHSRMHSQCTKRIHCL